MVVWFLEETSMKEFILAKLQTYSVQTVNVL